MPPKKTPGAPSSIPSKGVGASPAPATPPTPATPPLAAAPKPVPSTKVVKKVKVDEDKLPGQIYLHPRKLANESYEEYTERLQEIQKEAASKPAPKLSPGSFTLLTDRRGEGDARFRAISEPKNRTPHEGVYEPKEGVTTHTGEIRFEKELEKLQTRKKELEGVLQSRLNKYDVRKYSEELAAIDRAIPALYELSGFHHVNAKPDGSFYEDGINLPNKDFHQALEWTTRNKASQETRKMGHEIESRRKREIDQLKSQVATLVEKNTELKKLLDELTHETKNAFEGKMPEHVKAMLIEMEFTLNKIQDAQTNGTQFDPPSDDNMAIMLRTIKEILEGNIFGKEIEEDIEQEKKSPHDILAELSAAGEEITQDTLTARGMKELEAEALITLLKKEGIIS